MVKVFRSIKCTPEDFDIYEGLLKECGSIRLRSVISCKQSDVIGLQAFIDNVYVGKTLLLSPCGVTYDRWGFPTFRFSKYVNNVTNSSEYYKFKNNHLMSINDV